MKSYLKSAAGSSSYPKVMYIIHPFADSILEIKFWGSLVGDSQNATDKDLLPRSKIAGLLKGGTKVAWILLPGRAAVHGITQPIGPTL